MNDNPYQPSLVPPWKPPGEEPRGISIGAIALGALTDLGGTLVLGVVLGVGLTIYFIVGGIPLEDMATEIRKPVFFLIGFIPGMTLTVLGGYVAGRVARRAELLHGGICGSISGVAAGLVQYWQGGPLGYLLFSVAIAPPLALLGAGLARKGRHKRQLAALTRNGV